MSRKVSILWALVWEFRFGIGKVGRMHGLWCLSFRLEPLHQRLGTLGPLKPRPVSGLVFSEHLASGFVPYMEVSILL